LIWLFLEAKFKNLFSNKTLSNFIANYSLTSKILDALRHIFQDLIIISDN